MPKDHMARGAAKPARSPTHTAERYIQRLRGYRAPADATERQRSFKSRAADDAQGDVVIGVRMKQVFELSREFREMPLGDIEKLLESRIHEVRAGGVKIMAYQAASTTTPEPDAGSWSSCTCGVTTGSTTGTWSTSALGTWSAGT
jgi:hypothetical protein